MQKSLAIIPFLWLKTMWNHHVDVANGRFYTHYVPTSRWQNMAKSSIFDSTNHRIPISDISRLHPNIHHPSSSHTVPSPSLDFTISESRLQRLFLDLAFDRTHTRVHARSGDQGVQGVRVLSWDGGCVWKICGGIGIIMVKWQDMAGILVTVPVDWISYG